VREAQARDMARDERARALADDVRSAEDGVEVVAAGRAIAPCPPGWPTVSHIRA
jgi:hypothetical protein